MKSMTFEETKQVELNILLEVARFCDVHNLTYFLAYGTLIGAIRHKGFIPWDDDIDIQMPRKDYNRLIEIFNRESKVPYLELISPNETKARHSFVKIIDTRTKKIEGNVDYKNGDLGVDIDIFPLDGQPEDEHSFLKWYNKLNKIYQLYTFTILKSEGSLKKRIGIPLIKFFFKKDRLKRKADKLHSQYPYEQSKYIGAIESSFNSKGNRIDKTCYESFVLVAFEGHQLKAPVGYDDILTKMYGKYMELPPKEKQVTHHLNNTFWKDDIAE